jgi:hypothetical protein
MKVLGAGAPDRLKGDCCVLSCAFEPYHLLLLFVLPEQPGTEGHASIGYVRALPVERHHMIAVIEDNHLRKAAEFPLQQDRIADVALVIKARVEDQCGLLDLA